MRDDFLVIDADAHVIETDETWEFLEGSDRAHRPIAVSSPRDPLHQYWIVDGRVAGPPLSAKSDRYVDEQSAKSVRKMATPVEARTLQDVDLRLKHMSELGIDVQVLHNTLWIGHVTNRPDTQLALCRSWNRWLAEIWKQGQGRLRWTCVVPTLTLDAVEEEVRFAKAHGAVGICLQPFERDLMMLDPYYYPLYQVASDLEMPIIVHVANGDPALGAALRTRTGMLGGLDFLLPALGACFGLIMSDVPSTFPSLRWAIVEAGAGWIPWMLQLAGRVRNTHFDLESNPFVTKGIYVTTEPGDDFEYLLQWIGEDRLVIGTDYGHTDPSSDLDALTTFRSAPISETAKRKILSDNPTKLYDIAAF
jgi:predicted TIM-barrel fold metal-dependent hydrolase